jgi:hypothetical protein
VPSILGRRGVRWAIHLGLAVLGAIGIAYLVRHAGPRDLARTLREAGPWFPLAFAIEGARIAADAWRTRLLYARGGRRVAWTRLLPIQLASYPINLLVPAGGAASEAFKAATLAEEVGGPLGAATATTNQALALFGGFVVSIPCAIVALSTWGPTSPIAIAIAAQAGTAVALGVFIQFASRRRFVEGVVGRVNEQAGAALQSYRAAVGSLGFLPADALGAAVLGKSLQIAGLVVLSWAAGALPDLRSALLVGGVHLVGGAAGDVVPAQIGATDAAFTLAAGSLGVDASHALAIPLLMHAVQLGWAALGAVAPLRAGPRLEPKPE